MILLHETQSFSPISVFSLYQEYETVQVEACENYQKRSLRNKYFILTSQGVQALTIPLKSGKNQAKPIKEVMIAHEENWIKQHMFSLRTAYGKSPFFEYYEDELNRLFYKQHNFLFDFNMEAMTLVMSLLSIKKDVTLSTTYGKVIEPPFADYRNFEWQKPELTTSELPYVQVWTQKNNFYKNLSILDALFNTGPQAKSILTPLK